MMNLGREVQLLDCTLRDGGHINNGRFGKEVIQGVIEKLVDTGIDILEIGFLWDEICNEDVARFNSIDDVKRILPPSVTEKKRSGNLGCEFSLMADFVNLEQLATCDGTIDIIRLSFKRHRIEWALETATDLMAKGYKVFINPVNCNVYTDTQYLDVIKRVNQIRPYGFSIVDTFGVMRVRDLVYRYGLVENNLDRGIRIGLHLHENLGLSYSLAQEFIRISSPTRNIVIDGSLLGMGRVPGNLCIEQIMDHMNYEYGKEYQTEPAFDAIDDYIAPLKKKDTWGYDIPYALSAGNGLHRTYAEFLIKKWKLRTSDIKKILSSVSKKEAEHFNQEYIEKLYREYMCVETDDKEGIEYLSASILDREVLLIAPGVSINKNCELLKEFCKKRNPIVIAIHCVPDFVDIDYEFFSNIKRMEVLRIDEKKTIPIITSNLIRYEVVYEKSIVINYSSCAYHDGEFCDDSVLMMLNLLKRMECMEVSIAGFDGIRDGKGDFYIDTLSRTGVPINFSNEIKHVLFSHYADMKIHFLTDSYYRDYDKL